jgi:glycosyltransferase involved in cell wall biosynthesis
VTFTGNLDNVEIGRLYESADLLLNPSLADNMPISILEALASGVPVVSTNVGGVPHVVANGETALLVDPGDVEQMANEALSILGDERLAKKLMENGLRHVRQFEWPSVRLKLIDVYRMALSRPLGGAVTHGSIND